MLSYGMNKIIILRGNIGSGKTTTSQALQRRLGRGTLLIPQDVVRREMLWVKDTPNNPAVALLKHLVDYGHSNCTYTILEGILYADYYQNLFDHIQKLYGDQVYAYYLQAPFETTFERQKNRPLHNKFNVEQVRAMWRDNDPLPHIKATIIDTLALDTDAVVAKILADLDFHD